MTVVRLKKMNVKMLRSMQCKRMESFKIKKKALKVTRFFLEADKEAFG